MEERRSFFVVKTPVVKRRKRVFAILYDELIAVREEKVARAQSVYDNEKAKLDHLQAKKDARIARANSKAVKADQKKLNNKHKRGWRENQLFLLF